MKISGARVQGQVVAQIQRHTRLLTVSETGGTLYQAIHAYVWAWEGGWQLKVSFCKLYLRIKSTKDKGKMRTSEVASL